MELPFTLAHPKPPPEESGIIGGGSGNLRSCCDAVAPSSTDQSAVDQTGTIKKIGNIIDGVNVASGDFINFEDLPSAKQQVHFLFQSFSTTLWYLFVF